MSKTTLLERNIPSDYENRKILEEDANLISELAPPEYKQITYLYYIARYLVVVYETAFSAIPIQVWNEYRNAFDHYIRHITKQKEDTTDHIKKIEGHIQRAVLDVAKLICHHTEDLLAKDIDLLNKNALMLIDNGGFYNSLLSEFDRARSLFVRAKTIDIVLGEDANHNNKILSAYLDSVYGYINVQVILRNKRKDIQNAYTQYLAIRHESKTEHILLSLAGKAIWVGGGGLIFWLISYFF